MEQKAPAPAPVSATPAKKRRVRLPKFGGNHRTLTTLIFILAVAAAIFFGWKWHQTNNQLKNPQAAAQAETASLVAKVSKLTVLPTGETPTVATVSDVSKLSGQTFFANAKNGDKVLIYSRAQRAYLYRPSTNQIINIAPLNVNTTTPTHK